MLTGYASTCKLMLPNYFLYVIFIGYVRLQSFYCVLKCLTDPIAERQQFAAFELTVLNEFEPKNALFAKVKTAYKVET